MKFGDRRGSLAPQDIVPPTPRKLSDRERVNVLLDELIREREARRLCERLLGLDTGGGADGSPTPQSN